MHQAGVPPDVLHLLPGRGEVDYRTYLRELAKLPMEELIKVSRAPKYLGPVRDGRALTRDPFDPDAPSLSADIPMILGNTHDETRNLIGRADPRGVPRLPRDRLEPGPRRPPHPRRRRAVRAL